MDLFKTNEVLLFTGSLIETKALTFRLEEAGISFITKDRHNSGIMAGFAASGLIQVFVNKENEEAAKVVLANFNEAQRDA